MKSTIDDVVDLERYPIASDGAARQAVVDTCRQQLLTNGVALLSGFVNPRAVVSMADEAARQSGDAFLCDDTHNVYLNDAATFQGAQCRCGETSRRRRVYRVRPSCLPNGHVLAIFAGRVSLHCVTEVLGAHPRFVAVLAFNSKPGVMNGDEVRQLFWGRTS